jgi:chemotaxis protein methyltransferase CheR
MKVLQHCIKGEYNVQKMKDIPAFCRERYFDKNGISESAKFTVKPILRNIITFKRLNLSAVPFPMKGPMDMIFCRNVVIYFDNIVRKNLLNEFYRLLKPGGYLMVGHAESLTSLLSSFKTVMPSVYVKL